MTAPAHIVLTGPAGSGKTTIAAELSGVFPCVHLETRRYHPLHSAYSRSDAEIAFIRYLAALREALAGNQVVVSEGFFLSSDRRFRVWSETTRCGSRTIPVTLNADSSTLESRLKARFGSPVEISPTIASEFASQFQRNPWGHVVSTESRTTVDVCSQLKGYVTELGMSDAPLCLYFDNTALSTLLTAFGKPLPAAGGGPYQAITEAIDGLAWSDFVTYMNLANDPIHRDTATRVSAIVTRPGIFAEVLVPFTIDSQDAAETSRAAITETVDFLRRCEEANQQQSTFTALFRAASPNATGRHWGALRTSMAYIHRGQFSKATKANFGAVSWFIRALREGPHEYEWLRRLVGRIRLNDIDCWVVIHRLYRCYLHLLIASQKQAVYWPSRSRAPILRLGPGNPLSAFRHPTSGESFLTSELPADHRLNSTLVPFLGALVLARVRSGVLDENMFVRSLEDIRNEPDILALRKDVRCYFSELRKGPTNVAAMLEIVDRLRETSARMGVRLAGNALGGRHFVGGSTSSSDGTAPTGNSDLATWLYAYTQSRTETVIPLPATPDSAANTTSVPDYFAKFVAELKTKKVVAILILLGIVIAFLASTLNSIKEVLSRK